MRGLFIVFEGIEGCGKTTQSNLLVQSLETHHMPAVFTCEPTKHLLFGRLARFILKNQNVHAELPAYLKTVLTSQEYHSITESFPEQTHKHLKVFETYAAEAIAGDWTHESILVQYSYMLDRCHHRQEELPLLEQGTCVVSDRDFLSTLACGGSEGVDWHELFRIQKEIVDPSLLFPDIIVWLTMPADIGYRRTVIEKQNGAKERFDENNSTMAAIYREVFGYLQHQTTIQMFEIDGNREKHIIQDDIWKHISNLIPAPRLTQ